MDMLPTSIASAIAIGELGLFSLAGFVYFHQRGNTLAEAASYALVSVIMMLSFIFQLFFLIRLPLYSIGVEIMLSIFAVILLYRLRHSLLIGWRTISINIKVHRMAATILLICAFYLMAVGGCTLFDQDDPLILQKNLWLSHNDLFMAGDKPLAPVNTAILAHFLSRLHIFQGAIVFSLMAYLSIAFSTYALSRRYAWPPTAFTVTMLVVSMPRLVYLATSAQTEIITAAVSLFCILAVYRALERPSMDDLCLLIFGILFTISENALIVAFPMILTVLAAVLLFRRHGAIAWIKLIRDHRGRAFSALLPALIFSQVWLFGFNLLKYGDWVGCCTDVPFSFNTEGLLGALENMACYLLESAHLTLPVNLLCQWVFDFCATDMWIKIYDLCIYPISGAKSLAVPFTITWIPNAKLSWFGPFGFLFIVPALIYAMLKGPRRLKATAVALAGYLYITALIVAWRPENVRYFTILYSCAGFLVAFLLPPWRFTRMGKCVLQSASALLILYACVCNTAKPLVTLPMTCSQSRSTHNVASKTSEKMDMTMESFRCR
jgi:hypothetical protein